MPSLRNRYTKGILKGTKITSALLSSAPNSIYSLLTFTNKSPSYLLLAFKELSRLNKGLALTSAAAALSVNAELNMIFFNTAAKKIKQNISESRESIGKLATTAFAAFFGIAGGITNGALAYEAFSWLPGLVYLFTAFNTAVYTASRYVGASNLIERCMDREDFELQKQTAEKLNQAQRNYLSVLEETLDESLKRMKTNQDLPLSESDFEALFMTLAQKLDDISEHASFEASSKLHLGQMFDISLAVFISAFAFITFSEKGESGFNLIAKIFTKNGLQNLPQPVRILIGSLGGIPSSSLYGVSALDFRSLLLDAIDFLRENPKALPEFTTRLTANIITATGMYYVGHKSTIKGNLFNLPQSPALAITMGAANGLGSFLVNMGPSLKKFEKPLRADRLPMQQLIKHYQNPLRHPLSKTSLRRLKEFSLFQNKQISYDVHAQKAKQSETPKQRP